MATRWTMPKPVRCFIVFALFRDQKENISSRRIFSSRFCLLQIEKIRRNETRSAKRRECLIVRRASIEFLLFYVRRMRCSRARREIQFSGFPWFCNTLLEFRVLVVKGKRGLLAPRRARDALSCVIIFECVYTHGWCALSFSSLLLNKQKRQRFAPRQKRAGRNLTAWKNSARPSRKRSTSSRIL